MGEKMKLNICLLILISVSVTSCHFFFKKPKVKGIHDIKVKSITPDRIDIVLSIEITNPNGYKLQLQELNVFISDKARVDIGNARISKPFFVSKQSSAILDVDVSLDTRRVAKVVSHSKQTIFLNVRGNGKGTVLGFRKDFEFDAPFELPLKKHLEDLIPKFTAMGQDLFKVQNSSVRMTSINETELKVRFLIMNPYGITFTLSKFPADIYINQKLAGKGDLETKLVFDENIYSREGVMVFKINNIKTIVGAVKGVFKGEIAFEVKGNVLITAFGMEINKPFQFKDSINVSISDLIFK